MILPITLTIAGAAAIVNFWLAIRVVTLRLKSKVLVGDGGNSLIIARMRAHANYIEYTPFVLILIALIELAQGSHTWLWAAGIIYILGRILHPFGLDRQTPNPLRAAGILITWVVLIGLAGYALSITYTARNGVVGIAGPGVAASH